MRSVSLLLLLALTGGCTGAETDAAPPPLCQPGELTLPGGGCLRPGVPLDGCGEGFVHDGDYGCVPVLPAEPCPPGRMAVPGDDRCHAVMECGDGRWGDLPIDGTTEHVDGTYTGSDADGSEAHPWPTIGQAVAAAAPDALIAVAAGTYLENVVISGKPVRLWGVCPEQVAIEATSQPVAPCPPAAVCVVDGADGTEVGGLATRGAGLGLSVSGAEAVLVDRVWVHDNLSAGLDAESARGPTSVQVRGCLIEDNHLFGLYVVGAQATVEATAVRTTQPDPASQQFGYGLVVQLVCAATSDGIECDPEARGSASVSRSLVEQNHSQGIHVSAADVTIDTTVVRATAPNPLTLRGGYGIAGQLACVNTSAGPKCYPEARADIHVTRSVVEHNQEVGLYLAGVDATVDRTVVRATLPSALSSWAGYGLAVQVGCTETPSGLRSYPEARAHAEVTDSLIDQSSEFGVYVIGADATVDATVVRATAARPLDGRFGDGVVIVNHQGIASATLSGLLVADSARAGLATFGAVTTVADSHLRCAAIELTGEAYDGFDFEVIDRGGNACGCPAANAPCKLVQAGLAPPDDLPPAR